MSPAWLKMGDFGPDQLTWEQVKIEVGNPYEETEGNERALAPNSTPLAKVLATWPIFVSGASVTQFVRAMPQQTARPTPVLAARAAEPGAADKFAGSLSEVFPFLVDLPADKLDKALDATRRRDSH